METSTEAVRILKVKQSIWETHETGTKIRIQEIPREKDVP